MEDLKLHGAWTSPYGQYVLWALKLEGIPFEYIEEHLSNKSDLLLQYNPVHNKIPVLVNGGRPICESTVIIEFLEEKWPQHPPMPSHTQGRAMAWFCAKLAQEKVLGWSNITCRGKSITSSVSFI
ncbi:glutathione S-transferase U5 [Eucalyptus grandis]|uniref:glutathione S-transferase U5 n=1 Tax=Eucalyptus grandis TaxID=71139 RepID=UPI0005271C38|nr:glutathione S-transferase U5 [Eucalyptus grandis]